MVTGLDTSDRQLQEEAALQNRRRLQLTGGVGASGLNRINEACGHSGNEVAATVEAMLTADSEEGNVPVPRGAH